MTLGAWLITVGFWLNAVVWFVLCDRSERKNKIGNTGVRL